MNSDIDDRPRGGGARALAVAVLLLIAGALGCSSTHEHSSWGLYVDPDGEPVRFETDLPEEFETVGVHVRVPDGRGSPPAWRDHKEDLEFPARDLAAFLGKMLDGSHAFSRVVLVEGETPEAARSEAEKSGVDILLDVALDRPYVAHIDGDSDALWAGICWVFGGWATHWWHDQIFELQVRASATLVDLRGSRVIGRESLPLLRREEVLSFHERNEGFGTYLITLIWPPGWVTPDVNVVMESMLSSAAAEIAPAYAELLGRLYRPEVLRITGPTGADLPVRVEFASPTDGALAEKEFDLDLTVKMTESLEDLRWVKLGDEVLWEAGGPADPKAKAVKIQRKKLSLKEGKSTLRLQLASRKEPVTVEIARTSEVRLRDLPRGG